MSMPVYKVVCWRRFLPEKTMRRWSIAIPVALLVVCSLAAVQTPGPTDWPAAGGDLGGMKYAAVAQITPANVTTLKQAWSYDTGGPVPIVINNLMYFVAGGNVVALNADAGTEAWKFALS